MNFMNWLNSNFVYTAFDGSTGISSQEFLQNNISIVVIAAILFVYWLALLLLYEQEFASGYKKEDDKKLFDKYNPMMAACIAQNRNIMCRDVIAVVLDFINRGKVNIRLVPDNNVKDIGYRYMISENPKSKESLDLIEREIYDWVFEGVSDFKKGKFAKDYISKNDQGIIEIDLIRRFKEFSQNEDTYAKMKELNLNVNKRLNVIGANKRAVPRGLKTFNNSLVILSLILVAYHILHNGLNIVVTNVQLIYYLGVAIIALVILPVIYIVSIILFQIVRVLLKNMQQMTEGYTGRKLISKTVSILFSTAVLMVLCGIFASDFYLVYDILLLGVSCLIIFTDDYMIKHEPRMLNDYYNLKRIENKIKEYSLMEEENIEYVELWDEYYAYAVALGIPFKVKNNLDIPLSNSAILTPKSIDSIWCICKSYFDLMWDNEFYDDNSAIDIEKLLRIVLH